MRTLSVALDARSYPIHIGAGLLADPGLILPYLKTKRVAVITNTVVGPLYLAPFVAALRERGLRVTEIVLPDGEAHKDWPTLNLIFDGLLGDRCDRSTTLRRDGDDRTQRCACGDTERERRCECVAKHRLKQHTRYSESAAGNERKENARHSGIEENFKIGRLSGEGAGVAERRRTYQRRDHSHHDRYRGRKRHRVGKPPWQRAISCHRQSRAAPRACG